MDKKHLFLIFVILGFVVIVIGGLIYFSLSDKTVTGKIVEVSYSDFYGDFTVMLDNGYLYAVENINDPIAGVISLQKGRKVKLWYNGTLWARSKTTTIIKQAEDGLYYLVTKETKTYKITKWRVLE